MKGTPNEAYQRPAPMIGIILLIGIVKKNAILMIDFALEAELIDGLDPKAAIMRGCSRRQRFRAAPPAWLIDCRWPAGFATLDFLHDSGGVPDTLSIHSESQRKTTKFVARRKCASNARLRGCGATKRRVQRAFFGR